MIAGDELLAVRAAELYYQDDRTQQEIAVLLGVTRWKVGRLLAQAREEGIVRIEIVHPEGRRLPLERELRDRFGLRDAIVVPTSADAASVRWRVAGAAADYLTALRPPVTALGVSWGRTLDDVAAQLPAAWARGVNVVQVNGAVTLNRRAGTAASTASAIAQKGGGVVTLLPSPAILERRETKEAIEADRTVAGVLEAAAAVPAYLFSAGPADAGSALVESGYLTAAEAVELSRKGAVADVWGRFVDADGNIVDPGLDERTVGLPLTRLREAPLALAVIAGPAKHDVARVVVATGLCTVLITDADTATAVLKET